MTDRSITLAALVLLLACSGAAGAVLRDAGPAVRDAGRELMDAGMRMLGDASLDSGHVIMDTGTLMMQPDVRAQEPPNDGLPRGHWVLRDKDGQAVQGIVGPAMPVRYSSDTGPCVSVAYYGQRFLNVAYELATGRPGSCGGLIGVMTPDDVAGLLNNPPYTLALVY